MRHKVKDSDAMKLAEAISDCSDLRLKIAQISDDRDQLRSERDALKKRVAELEGDGSERNLWHKIDDLRDTIAALEKVVSAARRAVSVMDISQPGDELINALHELDKGKGEA